VVATKLAFTVAGYLPGTTRRSQATSWTTTSCWFWT